MNKDEIIIQRRIGVILHKLDSEDREILESYMSILESPGPVKTSEESAILQPIKEVETAALKRGKPRGSKYFSEADINNEIFRLNKDKIFVTKDGIKYHLTNMTQVLNIPEKEYQSMRNKAIINLHSKK